VERRLADRIRAAKGPEERRAIFATMYDELFAQVPDHPRIAAKGASTARASATSAGTMAQLGPISRRLHLPRDRRGRLRALRAVAQRRAGLRGRHQRPAAAALPPTSHLVLTDGRAIDVPPGSVDLAFSDQLMEHLHPDDAIEQLRNIHRALKPGGVYMCVTPNRLYGPSDISAFFDDEARGFHLKEYTLREMREIFARGGLPETHVYIGARGVFIRCPVVPWCGGRRAPAWGDAAGAAPPGRGT
jgi:SAM-dependent methyltransferase